MKGDISKIKFSRAKVIRTFFDQLRPAKEANQKQLLQAICASFNLKSGSRELKTFLHAAGDNFDRLILEIDFSAIDKETKESYRQQIEELSKSVRHPYLNQDFVSFKDTVILPNYKALIYVNEQLGIFSSFDQNQVSDLKKIAELLRQLNAELVQSSLPVRVRAELSSQIFDLQVLLDNFSVLGFDKAWEVASASLMSVQRDMNDAHDVQKNPIFRKFGVLLMTSLSAIAAINTGIGDVSKFVSHLRSGYETLDKWRRDSIPLLEHKKESSGNQESEE